MNLVIILVILIRFSLCINEDLSLMFSLVQVISRQHFFNFHMLLYSDKESNKLFYDQLTKIMNRDLGYSTAIQMPIEKYYRYANRSESLGRRRCLKILDGKSEKVRAGFVKFSEEYPLGDSDFWLLFLNKTLWEEYLNTLTLPLNVQLIAALIINSERIELIAPYKVGKNYPLRVQSIGNWTKADGLYFPTIEFSSARRNLENISFRTGTLHNPPITVVSYIGRRGEFKVEGFFVNVFHELSERLNFTYKYSLAPDNATGAMNPDKTWNGLIGMLLRDEIDIAVSEFTMTEARSHFIDFSMPITTTGLQIFFTQAGNSLEWGSFLRPLKTETWLVILAWIIVGTIAVSGFYTIGCCYDIENFVYKQEYTIIGSFLSVFRSFTNQGNNLTPQSISCRIVFSLGYLLTNILLPSYSAALISYLTVRNPVRPFNSLDEMLNLGTHQLTAARRTAEYAYFSEATEPLLKQVYNTLMKPVKDSDLPVNTREGVISVCQKANWAYYGPHLTGQIYADEQTFEKGCRVMTLEHPLGYVDLTIAFQKKNPYAHMINLELQRMIYEGILNRIKDQTWPPEKIFQNLDFEAIDITQVIQIHCILLIGYLISSSFFVFEKLFAKKQKFKKRLVQAFPNHRHFELQL